MTGYFAGGPLNSDRHKQDLTPRQRQWLDSDEGLTDAVGILESAFWQWGYESTLAFVRQGRSGFDPEQAKNWRQFLHYDWVVGKQVETLYNTCEYLRCIKKYLHCIDDQPELFDNEFRPDIPCHHI